MPGERSLLSDNMKFFNVMLLGVTFMMVFTGFQTCGMVEQTVLRSYKKDNPSYNGDGFTSLALIYVVFAVANWIAPSIVSFTGPKISMIFGGLTYTLYIATFIKPVTPTLYIGSVVIGIGAAVLWTAQGNFLTLNSDDSTMARNSGLFWALLQSSLLIGNLYVFFAWRGVTEITDKQRITLYVILTAVSGTGTLGMIFLRNSPKSNFGPVINDKQNLLDHESDEGSQHSIDDQLSTSVERSPNEPEGKGRAAWNAFIKAIRLFKTRDMMLLSITFFYTGLELTFFSGVYTTCVGGTLALGGDTDRLLGLTGIFIGAGEIFGGLLFGIFGSSTVKKGREPIVFLGLVVHLTAFFLIFLNIPDVAPLEKTHDNAYIQPNAILAVGCGLLLGFADACYNTQCYSIIGVKYAKDSAPAFALFKFEQSLAAAIGFFYSNHLVLKWQLLIMVIFGVIGTISFFKVESTLQRQQKEEEEQQ